MANLYLIGMMGSGKSATAKKLAQLLHYEAVDLDYWIEKKNTMSVAEIFERAGEKTFREEETSALAQIAERKHCVVATGGGIILNAVNIERMKASGKMIYLQASPEVLWERVKGKSHRPLLNGERSREKLFMIFESRKNIYESVASLTISTDGKTAEMTAVEIFEKLKGQNEIVNG